jgi:prepilin-type N-terminal cleavage/methylation domain-containing protein
VTKRIQDGSDRGHSQGFTLIELIAAMAIFLTIMGGVAALFVTTMKTVKQGFQNQEIFELARGTLSIIENDLSRAFTSREHGDLYKFYGTPIGFTFVGLVGRDQNSPDGNLARVTYVIYHDNNDPDILRSNQDVELPVYKLLRYYEPNREDLDDFPVVWYPPGGSNDGVFNLGALIDRACQCNSLDPNPVGIHPDTGLPMDVRQTKEAISAKKRELWIRMLSGGDAVVPSAWSPHVQRWSFEYLEDGSRNTNGNEYGLIDLGAIHGVNRPPDPLEVPRDYIVAENLLYVYRNATIATNGFDDDGDGVIDERGEHQVLMSNPTIFSGIERVDINGDGFVENDTVSFLPTPNNPFPTHFFSYREFRPQVQLQRLANGLLRLDYDENVLPIRHGNGTAFTDIVTVDSRFWNDMRNTKNFEAFIPPGGGLPSVRYNDDDDDGDGAIDEAFASGSPFTPTLPQSVGTFFTFFFESPAAGVPDFMRSFDQHIDIPTGYRRLPPS